MIPAEQHRAITKQARKTNHIERFNNTLRQRVSRLVRETLSFSKTLADHIGAIKYSDVVFWRVPSELTSRHAPLLLGKQIAKEIFRALPELESFVRIQDQRLHEGLGLLTTRFPNGFDG